MNNQYVYINGEFYLKENAKISVFDRGLVYGDGIFEGIRVYDNIIFKCNEHIERLYDSAQAVDISIPLSKQEMIEIIKLSCKKNNLSNAYIRLIVTRGEGDLGVNPKNSTVPNIICIAGNIKIYPEEKYKNGIKAITSSQRRNKATNLDPQIKSLNYLNNILAVTEANRAQVEEAIMLNENGFVTEGSVDNIFIVKKGVVYTPPVSVGILNGITRRTIIDICKNIGIPVYEKEFTIYNVYSADECFLTGSAAEIIAVTNVDNRNIGDGQEGKITEKLRNEFQKIKNKEGININ